MTDLPKLTAAALRVLRAASDAELKAELDRVAKLSDPASSAVFLAVIEEQDRRAARQRIEPIGCDGRRPTLSLRFHTSSDPDLVARVIEAKRLRFNVTEQVRKAGQ